MIDAAETFDGTWPYTPRFCEAAGFRQHYVDEGGGDPIICLHGEPTWGYLYRNMIPPLAERNRVLALDHMGFGKSDTPQDRTYTLRTHVENLTNWIEALDLRDITFLGQDWGGPIATQFTVRNPDRTKRLFYGNSLAGYGVRGQTDVPEVVEFSAENADAFFSQLVLHSTDTTANQLKRASQAAIFGPNTLDLTFPRSYVFSKNYCERSETLDGLKTLAAKLVGRPIDITIRLDDSGEASAAVSSQRELQTSRRSTTVVADDALVSAALSTFGGAVVEVRSVPSSGDSEG